MLATGLMLAATSQAVRADALDDAYALVHQAPTAQPLPAKADDGRRAGNTAARVVGGVIGAAAGHNLTKHSNGFVHALGTMTGIWVGQSIGDIATRDVRQVDSAGRPLPTAEQFAAARNANEARYIAAQTLVFHADRPLGPKPLPDDIQEQLRDSMMETAARRMVALQALADLDQADMRRSLRRNDSTAQANFDRANETYRVSFLKYTESHRTTWNVIRLAEQGGYDMLAHRLVMQVVPADLKAKPVYPINWQGLKERAAVIAREDNVLVSYNDMQVMSGEVDAARSRSQPRQR